MPDEKKGTRKIFEARISIKDILAAARGIDRFPGLTYVFSWEKADHGVRTEEYYLDLGADATFALSRLVSVDRDKKIDTQEVIEEYNKLSLEKKLDFLSKVLIFLSRSRDFCLQNQIDRNDLIVTIQELLSLIDYTELEIGSNYSHRSKLLSAFVGAVESLPNDDPDMPFGEMQAFIDIVAVIEPSLPGGNVIFNSFYSRIRRKILEVPNHNDKIELLGQFQRLINKHDKKEASPLGRREAPVLSVEQTALYEWLVKSSQNGKQSLKLELYKTAPKAIEFWSKNGVDIIRFWNVSDPYKVVRQLEKAKAKFGLEFVSGLMGLVDVQLGFKLSSFDPGTWVLFGDEILAAAQEMTKRMKLQQQHLLERANPIEAIKQKLVEALSSGSNKLIKRLMGQAKNLIRAGQPQLNLADIDKMTPDEVLTLLDENTEEGQALRANLGDEISSKQQQIGESVEALTQLFELDSHKDNFYITSRDLNDLYLAAHTNDCTDWTSSAGTSAAHLPEWMANPTQVFAVAPRDNGNLGIKYTFLLALENNVPVLVIDSIEAAAEIKDDPEVEVILKRSLADIQKWAKKNIGASKIRAIGYGNSRRIEDLILTLSYTGDKFEINELEADVGGVSEVLAATGGANSVLSEAFLQSAIKPEEEAESNKVLDLPNFEKTLRTVIELLPASVQEILWQKVEDREIRFDELFSEIISQVLPELFLQYPEIADFGFVQREIFDQPLDAISGSPWDHLSERFRAFIYIKFILPTEKAAGRDELIEGVFERDEPVSLEIRRKELIASWREEAEDLEEIDVASEIAQKLQEDEPNQEYYRQMLHLYKKLTTVGELYYQIYAAREIAGPNQFLRMYRDRHKPAGLQGGDTLIRLQSDLKVLKEVD